MQQLLIDLVERWLAIGGTLQPAHVGVLVGVSVFVAAMMAMRNATAREFVRRRAVAPLPANPGVELADRRSLRDGADAQASRIVRRAAQVLAPTQRDALSEIRKQMVTAGYFSPAAVPVFYATRLMLAVASPIVAASLVGLLPVPIPGQLLPVIAACAAAVGLIVPAVYLDWRRTKMRERYRNTFPEFMDLLVVCVEAGLSLPAAIEWVSKEIVTSCAELGANLQLVSLELRAGRTLNEALTGLRERLGIDEVQSLALLLKQSEELGTSLAGSLRIYSDEMRDKRLMRAEAKAQALPVKMVIPLGIFIFPVILLVIMVPLVIRIRHAFV
jgi:tight adherence protein C